ncbi:phage holin family protein [Cellulosispirillum alkaliphilum]|uniref:phage holin family protein n=1 Tax=Cellulosispirillum alkaliphilum TaxID=3039283 RepID=UPI003D6EAB55
MGLKTRASAIATPCEIVSPDNSLLTFSRKRAIGKTPAYSWYLSTPIAENPFIIFEAEDKTAMKAFLGRLVISALGLGLTAYIVPGIRIGSIPTLIFAALLLGMVNAVIKPLFFILTLPITILTLGLFLLVINASMLALVAALLPGFTISTFFSAVVGSIVLSIFSWLVSSTK